MILASRRGKLCADPANMLGDNAAVSLTVKPPYALINALLVKDLSGVDGQ